MAGMEVILTHFYNLISNRQKRYMSLEGRRYIKRSLMVAILHLLMSSLHVYFLLPSGNSGELPSHHTGDGGGSEGGRTQRSGRGMNGPEADERREGEKEEEEQEGAKHFWRRQWSKFTMWRGTKLLRGGIVRFGYLFIPSWLKATPPGPRWINVDGERAELKEGKAYPKNVVRNQKYSVYTFLPVALYQEFKFFFNLYFLVVALSQLIPVLQIGFMVTYLGPLVFVVAISLMKEAYDDYKRSVNTSHTQYIYIYIYLCIFNLHIIVFRILYNIS